MGIDGINELQKFIDEEMEKTVTEEFDKALEEEAKRVWAERAKSFERIQEFRGGTIRQQVESLNERFADRPRDMNINLELPD